MSLVFNDTSTFRGIIQEYENECGFKQGDVSGNTPRLKRATAAANLALDDFTELAIRASGTFQWDDQNHVDGDGDPDYPIITADLTAGQRDYPLTQDGAGNLILEFFKVLVADSSGTFHEVTPVDVQSQKDTNTFWDGQNATGSPSKYDKSYAGLFFDVVPSYTRAGGIKAYINREAAYFTYDATTRKPGFPGIFHRYIPLKMAEAYARRKGLKNLSEIQTAIAVMEANIKAHFARRTRDERKRFTNNQSGNNSNR